MAREVCHCAADLLDRLPADVTCPPASVASAAILSSFQLEAAANGSGKSADQPDQIRGVDTLQDIPAFGLDVCLLTAESASFHYRCIMRGPTCNLHKRSHGNVKTMRVEGSSR